MSTGWSWATEAVDKGFDFRMHDLKRGLKEKLESEKDVISTKRNSVLRLGANIISDVSSIEDLLKEFRLAYFGHVILIGPQIKLDKSMSDHYSHKDKIDMIVWELRLPGTKGCRDSMKLILVVRGGDGMFASFGTSSIVELENEEDLQKTLYDWLEEIARYDSLS